MRYREATDADGDAVAAVIKAVLNEYDNSVFDRTVEVHDLTRVATTFADHDGGFWLAEDSSGEVVGCIGIARTAAPAHSNCTACMCFPAHVELAPALGCWLKPSVMPASMEPVMSPCGLTHDSTQASGSTNATDSFACPEPACRAAKARARNIATPSN